jgi:hypothetical protein
MMVSTALKVVRAVPTALVPFPVPPQRVA